MKREIKFRTWFGPKWSVPNVMEHFDFQTLINREPYQTTIGDVVMQFTGLLDKNGEEIYEGDIVEYDSYYNPEIDDESDYNPIIYKVAFTNNCHGEKWGWDLVDKNGGCHNYYYGGFYTKYTKVVGNIYQNENLLNGTNS